MPIAYSALLFAKLAPQATLKIIPGAPHGMGTTEADIINANLLALLKS